ncbi:MAG: PqqD family protein [Nitrospinota bacterium]|nr:MAG: PqqD family protein [Nitrospinota bacterium]
MQERRPMMAEERQGPPPGPFIPTELRPSMEADEATPPLAPDASLEEMGRHAREVVGEAQCVPVDITGRDEQAAIWQTRFMQNPEVQWTALDGEAVLLDVETGRYYTLNRVGSVIWELFTGDRSLAEILSAVCERFSVSTGIARQDLLALVTQLRQEGLLQERR